MDQKEFAAFANKGGYETLIRGVVDFAIYMLDPEGVVLSWSAGAERIKGYPAEEAIGEHFSKFYTEEDRAAGLPRRVLSTAVQEGRFIGEGWRVRKDGTRFWAAVVIDAIRDGETLIGFAKITRDITEQREAQNAALAAERRFRLLVKGVTDYAIFMLDPEGRIVNWNAGAERIKGYSEAEILGEHFSRFYTPEDIQNRTPWSILETARRDGRFEAQGWRVRKDGTRFWANVIIDAIYDESGELIGFAKITRDLTERKQAEIELERSREQFFQAQKMEAVGQLTGGLAHDFNNLLTGISGSIEMAKTRLAQGRVADIERYLAVAHGAAMRAAALTHRLLAFARRQVLDPKPVDPNRLISGMEELVQRTVGPAITVQTVLALGLWRTFCDPNYLESAILNLCINARDAMPGGGHLTIETGNTWVDQKGAAERDMEPGQFVSISVTDTGCGMAPDVVARAFDPFYTTKPTGQGTGLGLSMVYGFSRQSGGLARIYSELGMGTTVRLTLPRYFGSEEEADANLEPEQALDRIRAPEGQTVLVVDDEASVRMLVTEVLEEMGYSAIEAADAKSGLRILQSNVRIDLLVTDVGLPGGMNGRQMADAARQVRPDLKILFITGYAENAAIGAHGLDPGMYLIAKPFAMDSLGAHVRAIVGRKSG